MLNDPIGTFEQAKQRNAARALRAQLERELAASSQRAAWHAALSQFLRRRTRAAQPATGQQPDVPAVMLHQIRIDD